MRDVGPSSAGIFEQSMRENGVNNTGMGGLGSPSTFMKLQTNDTTPECWYDQETGGLGVADIFDDHAL